MSRFYCTFHPWEEIVGVCSACLRERLLNLTMPKPGNDPQSFPDLMSSCGCISSRKRKNGGIYYKADEIRDGDLCSQNWWEAGPTEKKASKIFKFSGLRSLLGFWKKDAKNKAAQAQFSPQQDRSGDALQEFLDGEEGRKPWISSLAAMSGVGNRKAEFASARQSVSVRRSTVQRSAVKRSMSDFGNASYCGQDAGKVLLYQSSAECVSRSWSMSRNAPGKAGISKRFENDNDCHGNYWAGNFTGEAMDVDEL
ncbi:hypothetical protein SUGI_0996410 [Cryptomeria japonica]|uniref:uncharacterized protein LOC131072565 n=1 Tax=Cryptomeria japonica TaxID=3369 RepID=UPI002414C887|nr:uncharacterized protein LOC131072565 [Cryptomeria japonica]GLJ47203.1 hypothetical protein SUGI_0996410 [Cryptomeria japonica]